MILKTIINTKLSLLAKCLLVSVFMHGVMWLVAPEKFSNLELNTLLQDQIVQVKDRFIEVKSLPKLQQATETKKVSSEPIVTKVKPQKFTKRLKRKKKIRKRNKIVKQVTPKKLAEVKPVKNFPSLADSTASTKKEIQSQELSVRQATKPTVEGQTQVARRISKSELRGILRGYYKSLNSLMREKRAYPRSARRLGLEGTVLVEMVVNQKGQIITVKLAQSSGHELLDQAAIAQVQQIGKVPSMPKQLNRPSMTFRIPFEYRLQS